MAKSKSKPSRVQVRFDYTEPDRLRAIESSAGKLLDKLNQPAPDGSVWSLAESFWPALGMAEYKGKPVQNIALRLVPLSRIGQMEGKSGSLVLIGYLADADDRGKPHSHPVVIKTRDLKKGDKLKEEYDNALSIKPFAYDQKDNLAIPVHFDSDLDVFSVLWSIFSPSSPVWPVGVTDNSEDALQVSDLRDQLVASSKDAISTLEATFDILRNLHHRLNKASSQVRSIGDEYWKYFRKPDSDVWAAWRTEWGDKEFVQDAGGKFPNPFKVAKKLKSKKAALHIGAIHGDLHPGNIVLADGKPRIIDFGWAQDSAHIAKDFVLMECNLRFHTVRPQLRQADVHALSDWILWDEPIPKSLGGYASDRAKLIQQLREIAKNRFPDDVDWNWEYIAPLFLVSLGLLRFAPLLGNQQAAVRFTLNLSKTVNDLLDGKKVKK